MIDLESELNLIAILAELCENEQEELERMIDALTEEEIYT